MTASRRSELTPRYFDDDSDDDELTSDKSWRGARAADKGRHTGHCLFKEHGRACTIAVLCVNEDDHFSHCLLILLFNGHHGTTRIIVCLHLIYMLY